MEVVYNRDEKKYVTRMKSKTTTYNDVIALFRKINDEVIDTNENLKDFELNTENGNVSYGKFEIKYSERGKVYGVFSDKSEIESISGIEDCKTIDEYFKL